MNADLLSYISNILKQTSVRFEVHTFDSGCAMVDIWLNGVFYVVQIEEDIIGFSIIRDEVPAFDTRPDQTFTDEIVFKKYFENIFVPYPRKTIYINGNHFYTLEGFYNEIDHVLTKDIEWDTGHNLDAFNDLLRGGFGVFEFGERIKIIWINSQKSKNELNSLRNGKPVYEILISIIKEHDQIEFEEA